LVIRDALSKLDLSQVEERDFSSAAGKKVEFYDKIGESSRRQPADTFTGTNSVSDAIAPQVVCALDKRCEWLNEWFS